MTKLFAWSGRAAIFGAGAYLTLEGLNGNINHGDVIGFGVGGIALGVVLTFSANGAKEFAQSLTTLEGSEPQA